MVRLRPFHPDDDPEFIAWFPDAPALRMFAGDTLKWPLDRSQLEAIRADASVLAWTGWTAGTPELPVGHAELVRLDAARTLLARVGVAPQHRKRGLGRQVVEAVLAEASLRGVRAVELNVYAGNAAAIRLYRTMGFGEQGSLAGRQDVLRMARNLG